jgi:hypothetical protein
MVGWILTEETMGKKKKHQKDGEWMKEWKKHCRSVEAKPYAGCYGAYTLKLGRKTEFLNEISKKGENNATV